MFSHTKKIILAVMALASVAAHSTRTDVANLLPSKDSVITTNFKGTTNSRDSSKIIRDAVVSAFVSAFLIAEKGSITEASFAAVLSAAFSTGAVKLLAGKDTKPLGFAVLMIGQNIIQTFKAVGNLASFNFSEAVEFLKGQTLQTKVAFLVRTLYPILGMVYLQKTDTSTVSGLTTTVVGGVTDALSPDPIKSFMKSTDSVIERYVPSTYFESETWKTQSDVA
ncbi:hypothetical protein FJ366_04070 [Candidatus Dependentiae bacterium]|nr:hypothetical protein [Candidatus Dependentiae bacterium]